MKKLPALFIGHGSPNNLFDTNDFTNSLKEFGEVFFKQNNPDAIVIISAHWLSKGTLITASEKPDMIYDYYNFTEKFYQYVYPAKGSTEIADKISDFLPEIIKSTNGWGIDHAATIVLENILPLGQIPVLEMSLDVHKSAQDHFDLGRKLAKLREKNILFIGSGNLIHTFREMDYKADAETFSWARELDNIQKEAIDKNDFDSLIHYENIPLSKRGFQTNDHYFPLLYILGMKTKDENISYIYEGFQHGSISHRSFQIG